MPHAMSIPVHQAIHSGMGWDNSSCRQLLSLVHITVVQNQSGALRPPLTSAVTVVAVEPWSEPSVEGRCADLTRKLLQLEAAKPPLLKWLRSVAIEAFLAHDAQKKKKWWSKMSIWSFEREKRRHNFLGDSFDEFVHWFQNCFNLAYFAILFHFLDTQVSLAPTHVRR